MIGKTFNAKYEGKCGSCGGVFQPGDSVFFVDGILCCCVGDADVGRADEDPILEDPKEARKKMCPDCFMIHAGECL